MNSLWPSIPRVSCLEVRTILKTCHKVDSLAVRPVLQQTQLYSNASVSYLRRSTKWQERGGFKRVLGGPIPGLAFQARTNTSSSASKPLITEYQKLPKSYTPERGIPFRNTPLAQDEVENIFGGGINAPTANRLLMMIQGQRVSGTLEDPNGQTIFTPYEERARRVALVWLRENVPVDEVTNAGVRAEHELREMEEKLVADSERIGLYRPNSNTDTNNPYGDSVLDQIRAKNEERWEEKQKLLEAKSQADEVQQNTGTLAIPGPEARAELRRIREDKVFEEYRKRAKVLDKPPEMTKFQRLWPSTLVVLGTIVGCYIFAQVYTPPKASARLWPDVPPSAATIIGIILANAVILAAWRVPALYQFLNKNFITVPGYPYAFSLLGGVFSQQSLWHYASNMALLWFMGTRLHEEIGRGNFLAIYLSAGVVGNLTSLSYFVLRNSLVASSLGASGAVCGIVATYLTLNAGEKMQLLGVFPPQDWPTLTGTAVLASVIALEVYSLVRRGVMRVDHCAHLGGYAAGIVSGGLLNASRRRREAAERERRKNLGFIGRVKEGRRT